MGQRKSARFVLYLWFGRSFGRKKPNFMGFVDGRGRRLRLIRGEMGLLASLLS